MYNQSVEEPICDLGPEFVARRLVARAIAAIART